MKKKILNLSYSIAIVVCIFFPNYCLSTTISDDRTLFSELFVTNIFNVDEDNNAVYEREDAFISFATTHGYTNLILNKFSKLPTVFSKTAVFTVAQDAALEARVGNFLHKAHTAGIQKIGAQTSPYSSVGVATLFFDNVNEFNKRMLALYDASYCFDIIYTELDWWYADPTANSDNNWKDYFYPGISRMYQVVKPASIAAGHELTVATYIGNLTTLTTHTAQGLADSLDTKTDWVFIDFYFNGNNIPNTNPVTFFSRDNSNGQRMLKFALNSDPTVIIPLFSAESSSNSGNNFFGDNLIYDNTYHYGGVWNGTLQQIKDQFQLEFQTKIDPYGNGSIYTMEQLTQTNVTTPNQYSGGAGWFKHGCMPDAKLYLSMPLDNLNVTSCPFTLRLDEIVDSAFHNYANYPKPNNVNKANGFNASITDYRWYKNGVLQTGLNSNALPSVTVQNGVTDTWTCEIWVYDPNATGFFNSLKFRDDIKIKGETITAAINANNSIICQGQSVTFTVTPTGGGSYSYQWRKNSVNITNAVASSYSTSSIFSTDVFDCQLTATGLCGTQVTVFSNPLSITVNSAATTANAGSPQTICSTSTTTLTANTPTSGTGSWSVVNGPSLLLTQFSSTSNPAAIFTPAGGAGGYLLRWTISNPPCTASTSDVTITVKATPTTANGGSVQTICITSSATLAANTPTSGTGVWSVVSGPSFLLTQFSNTSSATSTFTPAGGAGIYVLRWTISNAPCTASTSDVTITVKSPPTAANAGLAQTICSTSYATLSANTPASGIGTWSVVSGPNLLLTQFSNTSSPTSTFTPSGGAGSYVLRWTISNPPCAATTSNVTITVNAAATANAGLPQVICAGSTVNLIGSRGGSATSSNWTSPSGTFSSPTTTTTNFTQNITSGIAIATLTTNDPAGPCPAAVSTVAITVNLAATVSAGTPLLICAGTSTTLAGSFGGSATGCTWSAPSGSFANPSSPTSNYTPSITSGTVLLTLTTNDPAGPCGAKSSTVLITVGANEDKALLFDGAADRCQIPHNNVYNVGTGAFTIEAQIEWDPSSTVLFPMIVSKRASPGAAGFFLAIYNYDADPANRGKLFTQFGGVLPNIVDVSGPVVTAGCHTVALTRSAAGAVNFYVDGVKSTSPGSFTTNVNSTNSMYFGYDIANTNSPFNGNIGFVRFWNVERTAAQIQQNLCSTITPVTGLVGYWPIDQIDQNNGQVIRDLSSTVNNGVLGTLNTSELIDPSWNTICHGLVRLASHLSTETDLSQPITLMPNPSNGFIKITYSINEDAYAQIKIYDLLGRITNEFNLNPKGNNLDIDLSRLEPSIYVYSFIVDGIKKGEGKLIIAK